MELLFLRNIGDRVEAELQITGNRRSAKAGVYVNEYSKSLRFSLRGYLCHIGGLDDALKMLTSFPGQKLAGTLRSHCSVYSLNFQIDSTYTQICAQQQPAQHSMEKYILRFDLPTHVHGEFQVSTTEFCRLLIIT